MPSSLHEALVALCRESPKFVADLIGRSTGIALPEYTDATAAPSDLTEAVPATYAADAVVVFTDQQQLPLVVAVVEVQLDPNEEKRWRWPQYLATASAGYRCPALLIVLCPKRATATWARKLASSSAESKLSGLTWNPIVIGPDEIPHITNPVQAAREPELTVLSTITHGNRHLDQLFPAYNAALLHLDHIDPIRAQRYYDLVVTALSNSAGRLLEEMMSTTTTPSYTDRFIKEGEARGKAIGEALSILRFLAARGFTVTEDVRERVTTCTDPDLLETWTIRAATITNIDDLFA